MNAREVLESVIPSTLRSHPELAREIQAILHFNVTGDGGGTWTVDLTKSADWVSSGAHGTPKMTITVSADDLVKIHDKRLNANMAAMQGKLKFKPMDMNLAMKLARLLA
jgi:hypothetical protein